MYQHDIPPKMLETALDSAVEKVVSLVGVDINTASQAMLRYISITYFYNLSIIIIVLFLNSHLSMLLMNKSSNVT